MADLVLSETTFTSQVLKSTMPVVVDFWAEWCPPCKIIGPIIDELAKEYDGKVVIGKIDADQNPQTVEQYGVMSLPTVMVFKDGKPVESLVGAQSKQTYKSAIEKVVS